MKTKNLFMASVLCLAGNFAIGAVLTVDNNPTSNAQYSNIPAAIDAANDFDTLLVQPSALDYGNIDINKPLFVIGRGHNPTFGRVLAGELTITLSNVIIEGFRGGVSNTLALTSNLSNIVVGNCRYDFLYILSNCDNILISGNVINQFLVPIDGSNNILVLNNILNGVGLFVGASEPRE